MAPKKTWTYELEQKLIEMWKNDVSYEDMASYFGSNANAVRTHLYALGYRGRNKPAWKDWEVSTLILLRNKGKSWSEISKETGHSPAACRKKYGLSMDSKTEDRVCSTFRPGDQFTLPDGRKFIIRQNIQGKANMYLCERAGVGYRETFTIQQLF